MKEIMYVIPGTDIYKYTGNGSVVDVNTGRKLAIIENSVTLSLYGYIYTVGLDWLEKYVSNSVRMEYGYQNDLHNIDFKPYNLKSHGVRWDFITVFKKPVLYKLDHNFRLIPMYPYLAISANGCIVNLINGNVNEPPVNKDAGYNVVKVRPFKKGMPSSVYRHRLVAMAWVFNDDYSAKPIVDHKDGNKNNGYASNLEWVSFVTNNTRAAEQGLRSDNIDVKVLDFQTNNITLFASMTSACKFMGRSRINRLEEFCKTKTIVNNRYQIKLLNDNTAWLKSEQLNNYCVTIDNCLKRYKSLKDLKKDLLPNLPHKKGSEDIIIELNKLYPDIVISFPKKKTVNKEGYQLLTISTGHVRVFKTRMAMAVETNVSESLIGKYLRAGEEYGYKDYAVRKFNTRTWKKIKNISGVDRITIHAVYIPNGEVSVFKSLRESAKFFKVDKRTVKKHIKSKKPLKSYIISNT